VDPSTFLLLYIYKTGNDTRNHKLWRVLRVTGLEFITFLFFVDFAVNPIRNGLRHPIGYLPFSIMIFAGPLLLRAAVVPPSGCLTGIQAGISAFKNT
jgi:hypothetical protein